MKIPITSIAIAVGAVLIAVIFYLIFSKKTPTSITTTGLVSASSLNVTGSSVLGGLVDGGVLLTTGAPKLNYYSSKKVVLNSITNSNGGVVSSSPAVFDWVRVGNLVTVLFNWSPVGTIVINGNYIVFKDAVPSEFSPNTAVAAPVFFSFGGNSGYYIATVNGNDIRVGNPENPIRGFSSDGAFDIYGATVSYVLGS